MENIKKQVSDKDGLTISLNSIPIELFFEILSRLPVKFIARCRCVSKKWASILQRQDFTDMFMKMSLSRPRLFFALQLNVGKWLLFSIPQPLDPNQNSSPLVANGHMSFHTKEYCSCLVYGLLCSQDMICNPSTGQFITLPEVTSTGPKVKPHLGYDPIDKVHKVLCMSNDCRVLTLGMRDLTWRIIECPIPHCAGLDSICINGVLYYFSTPNGTGFEEDYMLVCFDVRSEKFKFLPVDDSTWMSELINYKGKLGAILPDSLAFFAENTISFELRVLDDTENNKWSKHTYELPPSWKSLVGDAVVDIVGMTSSGEFVFSPYLQDDYFYIFYYNVAKNTLVRVEIELGIRVSGQDHYIKTFIDHVENVKLMEALGSS